MKILMAGLLFSLLALNLPTLQAEPFKPKMVDVIKETQLHSVEGKKHQLVWWMPSAFWAAAAPSTSDRKQIDEIVAIMDNYTILAVIDGTTSGMATINFTPEEKIRQTTQIYDENSHPYTPIPPNELQMEVKLMFDIMKPVITNMMGQLGQNIQFLAFPAKTKDNLKIVNTGGSGRFHVRMGEKDFFYKLPLASLSPDMICKVDGESFPSNFKFCPFHGSTLAPHKNDTKSSPTK